MVINSMGSVTRRSVRRPMLDLRKSLPKRPWRVAGAIMLGGSAILTHRATTSTRGMTLSPDATRKGL
jgi:hypothetical protein